ncbi:MAG: response regulator [Chitinispirillales bacterium]|jgi:PAS domain S-box-containing protein|nr:response regulator [Chitinispirillales bacterium]
MKRIIIFVAVSALILFAVCGNEDCGAALPVVNVKLYTDVPGATPEEIEAIESFKAKRDSFVYGDAIGTDFFEIGDNDGAHTDFSAVFFEFMGDFFGINFMPYDRGEADDFDAFIADFDSGELDFAYGIAGVPGVAERYHRTFPIAGRRMGDSASSAYVPITIAVANDELVPFISIFNKYLSDAGGIETISRMYEERRMEYLRCKLFNSFTDDERRYIKYLKAENDGVISVGFMHDAYPSSFYNHVEREYQGVAPDILVEVTKLTGIRFEETVTDHTTPLAEIIDKLRSGEISLATHLLFSESRKNDFLWASAPYLSSRYALLSRQDFPSLERYQVYYHRVGVVQGSIHSEKFYSRFPGHNRVTVYPTGSEVLTALERGEQCLVMLAESMLWAMTNYHGKVGFKVNIGFDEMQEAFLGYNRNEAYLRSIVDKAIEYIDVKTIRDSWMNRSFVYSKETLQQRLQHTYVMILAITVALLVFFFLFWKNKILRKNLELESAKLSTVFSIIPDIAFYMDTNLRYINVNKAFRTFTGLTGNDPIGKTDEVVFPGQQAIIDRLNEMNQKVITERQNVIMYDVLKNSNGVEQHLETIKVPFFQNDALLGLFSIARDITEHKTVEAMLVEASEEKSKFLANMSHELRTPLNAIVGMSDLLSTECLSKRQRNYVKDICMASHSLLSIVNDILDISKVEAGRLELSPINYDFQEFVSSLTSMFKLMALKKGLEFEHESCDNLPSCQFGDDVRLRQALINICANAVNYTSRGHVGIKISATDKQLIFEIRDTGVGIKHEDIEGEGIFSPFKRANIEKNRNVQGTGLGLPISKKFVEIMGGKVEIESEFGKGSLFTVYIPREDGDESKIKRIDAASKNKVEFKAPGAKVLVVDDNALNLKVALGLLNLFDIVVDLAASGQEAIDAVQKNDYDLVFMDHMMPEMNGIEATGIIRKLGKKYAKLPIIALTANATQGVKEIFLASGLDDYVSKPIVLDTLSDILKKWIPIEKMESMMKDALNMIVSVDRGRKLAGIWEAAAKIKYINVEIGKNRVAGIEEVYRETLDLCYGKLPHDCDNLESFLQSGDLSDFFILIHGLKSSLSTIGAMELSRTAFELEKASKEGRSDFCEEALPEFLENLRDLHKQLGDIFNFDDNTTELRKKGDAAYLQEKAEAALQSAEAYRCDAAVEIVDELQKYDFGDEKNDTLNKISNALKNYEFGEAVELLGRLL